MIYVAGQPAYFNFSTSLKIQRPGYVCLYEHALLVFDWMLCKQAA